MTSDKAFIETHFLKQGWKPAGGGRYVSDAYKFRGYHLPVTYDFLKKACLPETGKQGSKLKQLVAFVKGEDLNPRPVEVLDDTAAMNELFPNERKKGA